MPTYRFSWRPFDDETVAALASDIGFRGHSAQARAYLEAHVLRPDDDFVRRTKDSLARKWLPQDARIGQAVVQELFDMRIGPMGRMPKDAAGFGDYVFKCRNSIRLRDVLLSRLDSFGDADRGDDWDPSEGFIPAFGTVQPARQTVHTPRPFPHQSEAWTKFDQHLNESRHTGIFKGLVVMPTGAGKTQTAALWLLRNWLDSGNRVLWLAHRDQLLRQAADVFYRFAGLATRRDRLRIRIVSGRHCRFHQIDPADDIVLCSVQSLARNMDFVKPLLQDPNLFVVIDEAHHAPAKSYRDAIRVLEASGAHHLLGLTATPTRTEEFERPELARLFAHRVLYKVDANELIARELLARPVPTTVLTGTDGENGMTGDDRAHLRDFQELSPEMLARLGRDEHRNLTIVSHYLENREKYGKTLIFAPDVMGAAQLTDTFRARLPHGTDAAYVASWWPDIKKGERVDNTDLIERYRQPESGLNVLINVEMLTEGADLPMTRTVFLARPTSSEILLRQMVGRAMRGPAAGGNKVAHLVSFEDHWQQFRDVCALTDVLPELVEPPLPIVPPIVPPLPIVPPPAVVDTELSPISWDEVIAVTRAIRASIPEPDVDVFEAVPHGMFILDYVVEGANVRHVVHVYDHQQSCWEALFTSLYVSTDRLAGRDIDAIDEECFGDCEFPRPAKLDVETVVERARQGDPRPEYVALEGRSFCDPRVLAQHAIDQDLRMSEVDKLLSERHTALARIIYPSPLDFRRGFDDARRELEFPDAVGPPRGIVVFDPPPDQQLRPGPHHDLPKILNETLVKGQELLNAPLQYDGALHWTTRTMKNWFGMAYFQGQRSPLIRINCVLDSPDVSNETMSFLLWHEFLHMHLKQGHTDEFRRLERMWPEYASCNLELNGLNERFGIEYW